MKSSSIVRGVVAFALLALSFTAAQAATLVYPNAKDAMFLIDIPADWTGEPAEEAGGFMNLEGPSGVLLSLRTVDASEYTLDDVAVEAREFVGENYSKVTWLPVDKEPEMWTQGGTGNNDGTDVTFIHVFLKNADVLIFEIRLVADQSDADGIAQGQAVIKTIRGAK